MNRNIAFIYELPSTYTGPCTHTHTHTLAPRLARHATTGSHCGPRQIISISSSNPPSPPHPPSFLPFHSCSPHRPSPPFLHSPPPLPSAHKAPLARYSAHPSPPPPPVRPRPHTVHRLVDVDRVSSPNLPPTDQSVRRRRAGLGGEDEGGEGRRVWRQETYIV